MKKIINKKIITIISILFGLGFIFGIVFLILLNDMDKYIIEHEINEYLSLINSNNLSYYEGFFNSFKTNMLYLLVIFISGIIFIFSPIILFINFYKGFISGFMISLFILVFKLKGLFYGILFMFPHEILNILIFGLSSILVLSYSYKLAKVIYKNENINLRIFIKKYLLLFLIFSCLLIITSLLEVFLNSFIINFAL